MLDNEDIVDDIHAFIERYKNPDDQCWKSSDTESESESEK